MIFFVDIHLNFFVNLLQIYLTFYVLYILFYFEKFLRISKIFVKRGGVM